MSRFTGTLDSTSTSGPYGHDHRWARRSSSAPLGSATSVTMTPLVPRFTVCVRIAADGQGVLRELPLEMDRVARDEPAVEGVTAQEVEQAERVVARAALKRPLRVRVADGAGRRCGFLGRGTAGKEVEAQGRERAQRRATDPCCSRCHGCWPLITSRTPGCQAPGSGTKIVHGLALPTLPGPSVSTLGLM